MQRKPIACFALVSIAMMSFWSGCYTTAYVRTVGQRKERIWRPCLEVIYAKNGDVAIKTEVRHFGVHAIKSNWREIRRGDPEVKYIIIPREKLHSFIEEALESTLTSQRKQHWKYPGNALLLSPEINSDVVENEAYIMPRTFERVGALERPLPKRFKGSDSYRISRDDLLRGEGGVYFFPYTNRNHDYQLAIWSPVLTGEWERRLWWGYPVQIFRFGPSQLVDVLTFPLQIYIGLQEFDSHFN